MTDWRDQKKCELKEKQFATSLQAALAIGDVRYLATLPVGRRQTLMSCRLSKMQKMIGEAIQMHMYVGRQSEDKVESIRSCLRFADPGPELTGEQRARAMVNAFWDEFGSEELQAIEEVEITIIAKEFGSPVEWPGINPEPESNHYDRFEILLVTPGGQCRLAFSEKRTSPAPLINAGLDHKELIKWMMKKYGCRGAKAKNRDVIDYGQMSIRWGVAEVDLL